MIEAIVGFTLWVTGVWVLQPPDNVVILKEDTYGNLGVIEVTSQETNESILISNNNFGVVVDEKGTFESQREFSESEIDQIFRTALATEPEPAQSYLIYFETGSDRVDSASYEQLNAAKKDIILREEPRADVIGHTDTVGEATINAQISLERAFQIQDVLISGGIDADIISVTSHGEGDLLIQTPDETPEPLNRRVEIIVR